MKPRPERMTYAQKKLMALIDERKLRRWCEENGFSHAFVFNLAFGNRAPTYKNIAAMCQFISPIEWLFSCDEKLPYEPDLYFILTSEEYEKRQTHFNYSRLDPNIYAKFCEKTGIQNTKIVRRCFNNRPESLLTYFTLKDCGFTDINLYNRVLENERNCHFFELHLLEFHP